MERKRSQNLPSVWMPRLYDIDKYDRGLKNAIINYFGTYEEFRKEARLIPRNEWTYFERQHDLMISLKEYCSERCGGDLSTFPRYVELRDEGYTRLNQMIQDCGGIKLVATRFGMGVCLDSNLPDQQRRKRNKYFDDLSWGPFDLEFGITLLSFIRRDQMKQQPPLRYPAIFMPTQSKLLSTSTTDDDDDYADNSLGKYLHTKILEYGGYENVARCVQVNLSLSLSLSLLHML